MRACVSGSWTEGTTTPGSRRSARARGAPRAILPASAVRAIEAELRGEERRRDALFEESRALRRLAQAEMGRIHDGRGTPTEIRRISSGLRQLAHRVRTGRSGDAGIAHDALQEAVEAILLDRILRGTRLPSPRELGVGAEAYLPGLGDLVGEIRRLVLASLGSGDLGRARRRLGEMEAVVRALLHFEAPRSIVPLKPKQDSARSLLERTRGDVTLAEVLGRAGLPPARRTAP